jgi:protein TonB
MRKPATRAPDAEAAGDPALAELARFSAAISADRRLLRVAALAAAAFHVVLFAVQFPTGPPIAEAEPPHVILVPPLANFTPRPPATVPPRAPIVRVPIPDPHPNEPEPVRSHQVEPLELTLPDDGTIALPGEPPPPPPEPDTPLRPDGIVLKEPRRVLGPTPVYPEPARAAGVTGFVVLQVIVGSDGGAESIEVLRPGLLGMTEAAVAAVRQWRWEPSTLNGRPVDVIVVVTVRFELQRH